MCRNNSFPLSFALNLGKLLWKRNMVKVCKIVDEDRQSTILEIAGRLGLLFGTFQRILMDTAKFVPSILTDEQKQWHVSVCQEMLDKVRNDKNFPLSAITGDKTWVYCYDPEIRQQSSHWKSSYSSHPKEVRQVKSNIKSLLVIFSDCEGIVYQEFVSPGQAVNQHYY
jgi:hypothetical protein